jgi:hypothetical protein
MPLKLRKNNGSDPLTWNELDGNFEYFTGSHAVTGSLVISGSGNTPLLMVGSVQNFTGPTSNADAITAGLPIGAIYRSDDVLCIVH